MHLIAEPSDGPFATVDDHEIPFSVLPIGVHSSAACSEKNVNKIVIEENL